jgi:EmrB/QacA subfamily drug resistance transporter
MEESLMADNPAAHSLLGSGSSESDEANTDFKSYRGAAIAIASAVFMAGLDSTIVNISLPSMAHDLKADTGVVSWVVLSYLLTQGATLLFFGRLSDLVGLKRVFLSGYAVFVGGSLLCGASSMLPLLLSGRFIQGLGASMLTVSAFALVPRHFPLRFTGTGFGIITTAAAIGTTVGAPLGGLITSSFSWHWIFLINVPVGALAFINACRVLPADPPHSVPDHEKSSTMDIPGVILSSLGLSFLMYSFSRADSLGWMSLMMISCLAAGILLLALFVLWEQRCRAPLVHLELLKIRPLLLSILAGSAAYSFLAGMIFLIPFYLETVVQLSTGRSGLVMMGYSIPLMLSAPYAGTLAGSVGSRRLCVGGMLLAAAACFIFAIAMQSSSFLPALFFLLFSGLAFGFFNSPNNNHIKNVVPQAYQGEVFGIMQTSVRTSMAIGVAIFEVMFSQALAANPSAPINAYQLVFVSGGVFCLAAAFLSHKAMKS